jgi:hypothetical protein
LLSVVISGPLRLGFSLTRRLGAGLVAFLTAQPIIMAVAPAGVFGAGGSEELFPAFWYLLLGSPGSIRASTSSPRRWRSPARRWRPARSPRPCGGR